MHQDEPLYIAIKNGDKKNTKKLIKNGIDINTKTDYHKTLLGVAIYYGQKKLVKFLISKGADVNAKDENGSLLHMAAEFDTKEHLQIAKILIKAGADVNAKKEKVIDEFDLNLIDHGLMEKNDEKSTRPLHEAVSAGSFKMVKLLISSGADINAKNETNNSVLHLASRQGNKNIIKLFIAKGVDVNQQNDNGKTPLSIAIKKDNRIAAKILKKYKAHE